MARRHALQAARGADPAETQRAAQGRKHSRSLRGDIESAGNGLLIDEAVSASLIDLTEDREKGKPDRGIENAYHGSVIAARAALNLARGSTRFSAFVNEHLAGTSVDAIPNYCRTRTLPPLRSWHQFSRIRSASLLSWGYLLLPLAKASPLRNTTNACFYASR